MSSSKGSSPADIRTLLLLAVTKAKKAYTASTRESATVSGLATMPRYSVMTGVRAEGGEHFAEFALMIRTSFQGDEGGSS
jgi:hypothetical protein